MLNFKNQYVAVFGAGSIGQRHIKNLWSLGYHKIVVYRQRNLEIKDLGDVKIDVVTNLSDLCDFEPKVAFITSPSSQHLKQAIFCAKNGIHLFIEKPLGHTMDGYEQLKNEVHTKNIYLQVGYMMRHHTLIMKMKDIFKEGSLGPLLSYQSHWGEYLPNWHPWEDYRESYVAKRDLGGGAALTLSHDIDLAIWLCGNSLLNFKISKSQPSTLEMETESMANIILEFDNGVQASVHLNCLQKNSERHIKMIFENGAVFFDYYQSKLFIKSESSEEVISLDEFDRNQMFVDEVVSYFEGIANFDLSHSLSQIAESEIITKICIG